MTRRKKTDGESGKGGWTMSDIKTWIERCEEHPDHQSGMISDGMIRARMCEEIADLREALAIQQGCCDGAAAQDAHVRREREEHRAEVEKLRAEIERLRDVLRRVVVYPSGDKAARVAFVSVGCQVSFPLHPQTTGALELLVEFDQARRNALEGKP